VEAGGPATPIASRAMVVTCLEVASGNVSHPLRWQGHRGAHFRTFLPIRIENPGLGRCCEHASEGNCQSHCIFGACQPSVEAADLEELGAFDDFAGGWVLEHAEEMVEITATSLAADGYL